MFLDCDKHEINDGNYFDQGRNPYSDQSIETKPVLLHRYALDMILCVIK